MAFDRYHAKFLSGSDARKILTLNEDLRTWVERLGKKYNAGKIFQEEALSIVERFRGMGYVTQAFFKVATGGSTGAVCNCHPDTCVSLKATGSPCRFEPGLSMAADAGYGASRIAAKCRLCGGCAKVCRFGAIRNPRNLVEIADSGKRKDL
ncbi:MAG TPA: hypothetical protein VLM75_03150 [Spirochaetota bacterium]|nr:hypothetical protein [Spirochaetota bacterium]